MIEPHGIGTARSSQATRRAPARRQDMARISYDEQTAAAFKAASCAEHVLDLFESAQPEDPRPRHAIEQVRAWVCGEVTMTQARTQAMRWGRPETCGGQHGMPPTLPARRRPWHTS